MHPGKASLTADRTLSKSPKLIPPATERRCETLASEAILAVPPTTVSRTTETPPAARRVDPTEMVLPNRNNERIDKELPKFRLSTADVFAVKRQPPLRLTELPKRTNLLTEILDPAAVHPRREELEATRVGPEAEI